MKPLYDFLRDNCPYFKQNHLSLLLIQSSFCLCPFLSSPQAARAGSCPARRHIAFSPALRPFVPSSDVEPDKFLNFSVFLNEPFRPTTYTQNARTTRFNTRKPLLFRCKLSYTHRRGVSTTEGHAHMVAPQQAANHTYLGGDTW